MAATQHSNIVISHHGARKLTILAATTLIGKKGARFYARRTRAGAANVATAPLYLSRASFAPCGMTTACTVRRAACYTHGT